MEPTIFITTETDTEGNVYNYDDKGKYHNIDDLPAVVWINGSKEWYQHGTLHRLNGPAQDYSNEKFWFKDGKLHRENGPACENNDGSVEYWENGIKIK